MLIPREEASLFFELYPMVMGCVYQKKTGIKKIHDKVSFDSAEPEEKVKARDCLLDNPDLIDDYVSENPQNLSQSNLDTILLWKFAIRGQFFVERNLKAHTIFLSTSGTVKGYGVLGLSTEITEILPMQLPMLIEAALLPWRGKIICDGLFSFHQISFGGGIKASLRDDYARAKKAGIITSVEPNLAKPSEATIRAPGLRKNL
jgi:hypothetical protein